MHWFSPHRLSQVLLQVLHLLGQDQACHSLPDPSVRVSECCCMTLLSLIPFWDGGSQLVQPNQIQKGNSPGKPCEYGYLFMPLKSGIPACDVLFPLTSLLLLLTLGDRAGKPGSEIREPEPFRSDYSQQGMPVR